MKPSCLVLLFLAGTAFCAGSAVPLAYYNPLLKTGSGFASAALADSAVRKLDEYAKETRRQEEEVAKGCLAKVAELGFTDTSVFGGCQKGSQDAIAKREKNWQFFHRKLVEDNFRRRISGWSAAPVRSLDDADLYYGYDAGRLRAGSDVSFNFAQMGRPSVSVTAWEDYLLVFKYSLGLYVPAGTNGSKGDSIQSVFDRIGTGGGSVSPSISYPLLAYSGSESYLEINLDAKVPFDIPGMGTVRKDVNAHVETGLDGSLLLVGRRDVLGVLLLGQIKYVYGFTKEFRDQLGFDNELGFGLAQAGVGLQVYNNLCVNVAFNAAVGGGSTDVVSENYPVAVSVSISR